MKLHHGSADIPSARRSVQSVAPSRDNSRVPTVGDLKALREHIAASGPTKPRRLVAGQRYFGLELGAFRAGAERLLERVSDQVPEQAQFGVRDLGEAFHLNSSDGSGLLRALVAGGLLNPSGDGRYRLTARFGEYALAPVVSPLARTRAKELIDKVCGIAKRLNDAGARNPLQIRMIAVSGSYMSLDGQLPELSFWLVLGHSLERPTGRSSRAMSKRDAMQQILAAISALSSFIVVRIVAHKDAVPRPFSVVFQASEDVADTSLPPWDRVRDWSVSITRWIASR